MVNTTTISREEERTAEEINEMLQMYRRQKRIQEEQEKQKKLEEMLDNIAPYKEGQVVSEVKIVPKIMINKWWGAVPSLTGAGAGLTFGASVAALVSAPVAGVLAAGAGLAYAGFMLGDKIPLNQDNWYAQGAFGTRFFGQKEPWRGKQYKTLSLVANVYKKDLLSKDWYQRNLKGNRLKFDKTTGELIKHGDECDKKEKNGEIDRIRMQVQPGWYNVGKIGTRLPDKVNYQRIENAVAKYREDLVKKGVSGNSLEAQVSGMRKGYTELEKLKANYAKIPQIEHLYPDEEENNHNIEIVCVPNFKDIAESIEAGKKEYHYEVLKNGEEWLKVGEYQRQRRDLYGKIFTQIPKQFFKEFFGLSKPLKMPNPPKAIAHAISNTAKTIYHLPEFFESLGARRYQITTRYRDMEEKQWFLDKDPIRSIFWGNHYELRKGPESKPLAEIKRKRIKSFLYNLASLGGKRPCYDIKIYNPGIADNKYFVRFLIDMAYQLEKDKEEHKLRFKDYAGKDSKGNYIPNMYNPVNLKEAGILGDFTPDRLIARSEIA